MTGRSPEEVPRENPQDPVAAAATEPSEQAGPRADEAESAASAAATPRTAPAPSRSIASASDPEPPAGEKPEDAAAGVPPEGERLVEEELPPDFWEEAQEPHPPSPGQAEQVRAEPDRPPREEVSASPREEGHSAGQPRLSDPAFETLQSLFPGRIISIDVDDQALDEDAPAAGPETEGENELQEGPE